MIESYVWEWKTQETSHSGVLTKNFFRKQNLINFLENTINQNFDFNRLFNHSTYTQPYT